MSTRFVFEGGRVVDPATGADDVRVLVAELDGEDAVVVEGAR